MWEDSISNEFYVFLYAFVIDFYAFSMLLYVWDRFLEKIQKALSPQVWSGARTIWSELDGRPLLISIDFESLLTDFHAFLKIL